MTPLNIEQVRKEFETLVDEPSALIKDGSGEYIFREIREKWQFYLTRAQQEHEWREGQTVAAWATEDGERVVSASTMNCARKDGGAMLSSMKTYNVPLYSTPPAPAVPDGWRELCAALVNLAEKKSRKSQGSPNHAHRIPGVWDDDNGELAGKQCAECAVYDRARAMLAAPSVPSQGNEGGE